MVVAGALFFLRLDCALLEPEEARYAEIPREMLAAGACVVPCYHGQPYYDKPPLQYWLVMAGYSVFGVHDWVARLVPGLCGVLSVLVAYGWGRRIFGLRAAFLAGMVLALSARFVYLGRLVAADAALSLCVVTALACVHIALVGRRLRWSWWLAGGAACGLGLLAKGPVTFVLVGVPGLCYVLFNRNAARPRALALVSFVGVGLATAAPWYVAVTARDPSFAEYFFWKHHVVRYLTPFDHAKPFWFYLPAFFAGTLPWSLLIVPSTVRIWRERADWYARRPPEIIFPLFAALWCLIFFSASGSKRVGYVLPALAPLALVFGEQLERMTVRRDAWLVALPVVALLMGVCASTALAAFAYWPVAIAIVAGALMVTGLAVIVIRRRIMTPVAALRIGAGVVLLECLVGVGQVLPEYAERFSLRREVLSVRDEATAVPVVCFPRGWDSVSFYLERDDVVVFTEEQRPQALEYVRAHPNALIFLRECEASSRLRDELGPLVFEELGRQGNTISGRLRLERQSQWAYKGGTR
jgi:4-amino-4-deoxy-L-arabinose transferase-like glycosyltransferase